MKPGTLTHTIAVILGSLGAFFSPSAPAQPSPTKVKLSKKQNRLNDNILLRVDPIGYTPPNLSLASKNEESHYPWKNEIVTTVFWIGEKPTAEQNTAYSQTQFSCVLP